MFSTILSGTVYGIECHLVHVEADLSNGLPCFVMVGNLGSEVKEAGERVRIALKNSGIVIPPMHIAVNISPGNIRKEGTGFDLPIAVAVLCAMGKVPSKAAENILFLGELSLDGGLKKVRGVLPIAESAVKKEIKLCIVPEENVQEAAVISGMKAIGAVSLEQVVKYLCLPEKERDQFLPPCQECPGEVKGEEKVDFLEIQGQENVKRAALIAAAGFHHMLIAGPPGTGKTMIARRLPTILPPLSKKESLEVSSLYSISGMLPMDNPLVKSRPFLSPHHTISPQALSGGGKIPRPGVISLAHRGAGIALTPEDVLAELKMLVNRKEIGMEEEKVCSALAFLDFVPKSVDQILEEMHKAGEEAKLSQVLEELIFLCMKGQAKQVAGSFVRSAVIRN